MTAIPAGMTFRFNRIQASLILDPEDAFARQRGVKGPHPRPMGDLRFLVVGEMVNNVRQDFAEPLPMVVRPNGDGYYLFFNQLRYPANGSRPERVMNGALNPGTYVVRVESDFYQPVERDDVDLPEPAAAWFFDLGPNHAYPFPRESTLGQGLGLTLLRGVVRDPGAEGIADAVVDVPAVPAVPAYTTDKSGQFVLVFPDNPNPLNVTVRVQKPNLPVEQAANVAVQPGRSNGLAATAFRGRVVNGAGLGIADTRITVAGQPGEARTDGEGVWTYDFGFDPPPANGNVTATLPTGPQQLQPNVPVQARATVLVPDFQFP